MLQKNRAHISGKEMHFLAYIAAYFCCFDFAQSKQETKKYVNICMEFRFSDIFLHKLIYALYTSIYMQNTVEPRFTDLK